MRFQAIARAATFLAVVAAASACATSYQSRGMTGGYSETQLSERVYQVRFRGNSWTFDERAGKLLLRRCAELTLEKGKRYFELVDQDHRSIVGGPAFGGSPHEIATVRILDSDSEAETAADAVTVIAQTDELAKKVLSPAARRQLAAFKEATPAAE